jgi:hypothetical protein
VDYRRVLACQKTNRLASIPAQMHPCAHCFPKALEHLAKVAGQQLLSASLFPCIMSYRRACV